MRLHLLVMYVLLMFVSCTRGVKSFDCDPVKVQRGTESALQHFPSQFLNHFEVFCVEDSPPQRPVPCWLEWYGSSELYPGRMYAHKEIVHRCIVHDAYHAYLNELGDECIDHATMCGWDNLTLELANADAD